MSEDDNTSAHDERQAIRRQLATQRGLISSQLARSSAPDEFPRSMTMRLLMRKPALVGKVALLLAARLGGGKRVAMAFGAAGVAAWLVREAVKRAASRSDSGQMPHG